MDKQFQFIKTIAELGNVTGEVLEGKMQERFPECADHNAVYALGENKLYLYNYRSEGNTYSLTVEGVALYYQRSRDAEVAEKLAQERAEERIAQAKADKRNRAFQVRLAFGSLIAGAALDRLVVYASSFPHIAEFFHKLASLG